MRSQHGSCRNACCPRDIQGKTLESQHSTPSAFQKLPESLNCLLTEELRCATRNTGLSCIETEGFPFTGPFLLKHLAYDLWPAVAPYISNLDITDHKWCQQCFKFRTVRFTWTTIGIQSSLSSEAEIVRCTRNITESHPNAYVDRTQYTKRAQHCILT